MIKDLSKNINPYFPSYKLKKLLKRQIKNVCKYPSKDNDLSVIKLAKAFEIEKNNIVLTLGSLDGMNIILKEFISRKIGILSPTFWGISELAKKNNCKIYSEILADPFKYNVNVINELAKKVDVIYICNPNNPTLAEIPKKDLLSLIKQNPECHFIIDETVLSFSENFKEKTLYKEVMTYNNLTVIISFSKIFNIGGLRLAVLFSNKKFVDSLKRKALIYKNNIFNEGIIDFLASNYFKINRCKLKDNLELFIKLIDKKYLDNYLIKDGSFILIKFNKNIDTNLLVDFLEKKGYIIANISKMYLEIGENWLRISVGKRREMVKLAKIINNYVRGS